MLFHKNNNLTKDILIVDGQPGCGKTLFNRIFNSINNIEIYYNGHFSNCNKMHLNQLNHAQSFM